MNIINDLHEKQNEIFNNPDISDLLDDIGISNKNPVELQEMKSSSLFVPYKEDICDKISEEDEMIKLILNIGNNVFKELGKGFNECIYHKAMLVDLYKTHYSIETKKIIPILFNMINVGYVETDIIVESNNNLIIIELKALDKEINTKEEIQINKYLKHLDTTKKKFGLIMNFSQKYTSDLQVQYKII